jgi:hypothetical protein
MSVARMPSSSAWATSCAAEKIQSAWRGYYSGRELRKKKAAAIFIQRRVRRWFRRRRHAAAAIRRAWRAHRNRCERRRRAAACAIQNVWRRMKCRQSALVEIFEARGRFLVFLTAPDCRPLAAFAEANALSAPLSAADSPYRLLRQCAPKTLRFPGSPLVAYASDGSSLVRKARDNGIPQRSIWCGHDHSIGAAGIRVTRRGVNPKKRCLFDALRWPAPHQFRMPRVAARSFQQLVMLTYADEQAFGTLVARVRSGNLGIRLFSRQILEASAVGLTIQSALRMFLVRQEHFRVMKRTTIGNRAERVLAKCLSTVGCLRAAKFMATMARYFSVVGSAMSIYSTNFNYNSAGRVTARRKVPFGYSGERALVVTEEAHGFLRQIIPIGPVVFAITSCEHLLKIGSIITRARSSKLVVPIPDRWLKRFQILRIAFGRPDEAKKRMLLWAWLTSDFTSLMTETAMREYCAATPIQSHWRGHLCRMTMSIRRPIQRKYVARRPILSDPTGIVMERKDKRLVGEVIHDLRGDYRPWVRTFKEFKDKPRRPFSPPPAPAEEEETNQSAKNLGMVSEFDSSSLIAHHRPLFTAVDPRSPFLTDSPTTAHEVYRRRPAAKPPVEKPVKKGAQQTDNSLRIRVQAAFTKLARLRQLGSEIQQNAAVDNTIEERRIVARRAKSDLQIAREDTMIAKAEAAAELRARSRLEREQLIDRLEEQQYQIEKTLSKRVRAAKQPHAGQDRQFAMSFIAMSRQLAQIGERSQAKRRKSVQQAVARQSVLRAKHVAADGEFVTRGKVIAIERRRHRMAELDRIVFETRLQEGKVKKDDRLGLIHERKRKNRERNKLVRDDRKSGVVVPEPMVVPVIRDETEGAIADLGQFIGSNLGSIEARALVDVLREIVSADWDA